MNPYDQYVESNRFRDDEYGVVGLAAAAIAKKAVAAAKQRGLVGQGQQHPPPQQIIVMPAPAPSSKGIMFMVLGSVTALGVGLAIGSSLAKR